MHPHATGLFAAVLSDTSGGEEEEEEREKANDESGGTKIEEKSWIRREMSRDPTRTPTKKEGEIGIFENSPFPSPFPLVYCSCVGNQGWVGSSLLLACQRFQRG